MRIFLLISSFINTVLYILVYAYYDYVLNLFGTIPLSAGFLSFIKLLVLIIIGFCIGLNVSLLLKLNIGKSYFDLRNFVIIGFIPAICLLLSEGTITNFIITKFFGSDKRLAELVFYLFSRQIIWTLWFGFSIGSSVRISFKKRLKHEITYRAGRTDVYGDI